MVQKVAEIKINQLINFLIQELDELPDSRRPSNNTKYEISDAMMAAFSIFFTQSPSFLEHQRLMKNMKKKDNAASLFKIDKIPCDNQITNLLDPLAAQTIYPVYQKIYQWLKEKKVLKIEMIRYKLIGVKSQSLIKKHENLFIKIVGLLIRRLGTITLKKLSKLAEVDGKSKMKVIMF
jgi:hypothetical protein